MRRRRLIRRGPAAAVAVASAMLALAAATATWQSAPGPEAGRRPPPARAAAEPRPEAARPAARPPEPVRVALADPRPRRLPAEGVPPGWGLREFSGRALVELVRDGGRLAVRLRGEGAVFAIYRDVVVDLDAHPLLAWSWRVARAPAGGLAHPAQVYVVFPQWPSPLTASRVVGYVWDVRAPPGTIVIRPDAPNVRSIVVDAGPGDHGTWLARQRNVREDFAALFGEPAPRVGMVALVLEASAGAGETLIADLVFSSPAR